MTEQSPEYLTRNEAAAYMRVTPTSIDRWIREGRLQKYVVAGVDSVRLKKSDLVAMIVPAE